MPKQSVFYVLSQAMHGMYCVTPLAEIDIVKIIDQGYVLRCKL